MKIRAWLLGNLPPPVGGQSLITKLIADELSFHKKINSTLYGIDSLIRLVLSFLSFPWRHNSHDILYVVLSRGKISIWRELVFCVLWRGRIAAHMHGNDYHWILSNRVYSGIIRETLRKKVNKMICVNSDQVSDFEKLGIHSVLVTNPLLVEGDLDLSDRKAKTFEFGFISVIMASKGIFDALDYFEEVLNDSDVRMLIAGPFRGDDEMREQDVRKRFFDKIRHINNLRQGSCVYIGEVGGHEKENFYASIKFLLFFSRFKSESFGLVIIEAMAMGVIPIISDNDVLRKTLEGYFYLDQSVPIENWLSKNMSQQIFVNRTSVLKKYSKLKFLEEMRKNIYENNSYRK